MSPTDVYILSFIYLYMNKSKGLTSADSSKQKNGPPPHICIEVARGSTRHKTKKKIKYLKKEESSYLGKGQVLLPV
jgi:hypothetical protein